MSWVVRVRDAMNDSLLAEAENGVIDDGGDSVVALRGFDAPVVIPPGSGRVLNLYCRSSVFPVPARGIVQMIFDDTPVFWGPALIVPHPGTPGAGPFDQDRDSLERVTVVGGERLLKDTVIGPRMIPSALADEVSGTAFDVAAIAYQLCDLYAHPALTIDAENFVATGAALSIWYAPEKSLYDALVTLVQTVPGGAACWVDASGAVHFEAFEPAGS